MDTLKKHMDTIVILAAFAACMLWMNGKFNKIETDLAVMRAVLIMQKIMPAELASADQK